MSYEKLEKELKELPQNFIVGFIVGSDRYEETNLHLLEFFVNKLGYSGSYVTINRPYDNLIFTLDKHKIKMDKLFFIDCITRNIGGVERNAPNCLFLDSPSNLTDLGIALHEYVSLTKDSKRFLFLDSLSTLFVHNDRTTMMRFIHYITGKMRLWNINGIMISLHEETDKKIIAELSQFCDKIVRV